MSQTKKRSFSSLFFNNDENESSEKPKAEMQSTPIEPIKFPVTSSNPTPKVGSTDCSMHMQSVMEMYEKGFEGLNRPGVEFFEYYKAVAEAGIDNPAAYKMAFTMLRAMEPSMTKESLLSQSQFYIAEIEKVHTHFDSEGVSKRTQLQGECSGEREKLQNEIHNLNIQLESIKNQISSKEQTLTQLDGKYIPKIEDIECKRMANDQAKSRILGGLMKIIEGIKINL